MRIAVLHWAYPPVVGGVESHLAMLLPALAARGHKVALLTAAMEGLPPEEEKAGFYLRRTPLMNLNQLSLSEQSLKSAEIAAVIRDFIADFKPDVIHAHNMHYFSPVHLRVLLETKRRTGIPLVLTAHNVWNDELWQEMCRWAREWDRVVAVSHYIKRELIKAGFPAEKIVVVHHGIDLQRFSPPSGESGKEPVFRGRKVIFHPARLSRDKGTLLALEALTYIRQEFPEVLLVLAASACIVDWQHLFDGFQAEVWEYIKQHHLKDNIYIRPFSWEEMPPAYQAADIVIYPSRFDEPFGICVIEGMACAKPLVVTAVGGMPEIVRHGATGFIIPPNDARALANACVELLRNPALAEHLGREGRRLVEKEFTVPLMVERTEKVLFEAIQPLARRRAV